MAIGMEQLQEFQNLCDVTILVIQKSCGSWEPAKINVTQNLGFLANFQQALGAFPCWRITHSVTWIFLILPSQAVHCPGCSPPPEQRDSLLFCCLQFCKAKGPRGGEKKSVIRCQCRNWNFECIKCQKIFLELYTMITQTKSILPKKISIDACATAAL